MFVGGGFPYDMGKTEAVKYGQSNSRHWLALQLAALLAEDISGLSGHLLWDWGPSFPDVKRQKISLTDV
jgi:hypothetical protein